MDERDPRRRNEEWFARIAAAVAVCVLAAGFYFYVAPREATTVPRDAPARAPAAVPRPDANAVPQVQFPVPQAAAPASLPTLQMSDSAVRRMLDALFGREAFEALFNPSDLIRRIVATVDNLPREKVAQRLMPVRRAPGPLETSGTGESLALGAGNAARYLPYVALAESVDTGQLVAAYVEYYPLFQQAYRELGYPTGYFNDRLVEVIDHLLAAPEPAAPIRLAQRKVLYEFADPELEARSAGQKMLMRIGEDNARRVKARLRALRGALANLAAPR